MSGAAALKRQLDSVRTLGSVVSTMKALASVRIGQYRRLVRSLAVTRVTLDLGFQVLLRERPELIEALASEPPGPLAALVLGSDRGLCGGFNERIVRFAQRQSRALGSGERSPHLLVAGWRAERRLASAGLPVERRLTMPAGASGIDTAVEEAVLALEAWREERGVVEVMLFHNAPVDAFEGGAGYRQRATPLLPLDAAWLVELKDRPWPSRVLPMTLTDPDVLFPALLRRHLSLALFGAFAESLASENAARLAAMQAAERSIDRRLEELERRWRRERQLAITEELLDIQAGFAALEGHA